MAQPADSVGFGLTPCSRSAMNEVSLTFRKARRADLERMVQLLADDRHRSQERSSLQSNIQYSVASVRPNSVKRGAYVGRHKDLHAQSPCS